MIFKDEKKRSLLQKSFFMTVIFFVIIISGLMMFADTEFFNTTMGLQEIRGDLGHRILIISCITIYFVRLIFSMFVFWKRSLTWTETMVITSVISVVFYSLTISGGSYEHPIGLIEFAGIILFIAGSYLNTYSEYERHIWKKDPVNKGRFYTGGLFRYSMHINYFGDCLLFTGFALIAHSFSLLLFPFFITLNFIFFIIPRLDRYLEEKYSDAFREYAKQTKKLIPFVY